MPEEVASSRNTHVLGSTSDGVLVKLTAPGTGEFDMSDISGPGELGLINSAPVPGNDTVYLTAHTGGVTNVWAGNYVQAKVGVTIGGHPVDVPLAGQDGFDVYRPGQVAIADWGEYPLHTAQYK